MMTVEELAAGIEANNARAEDPTRWCLRWLSLSVVPTGPFFTVNVQIPEAAAIYRLAYLMAWWPVTGAVRMLTAELADNRGQKFMEFQRGQNTVVSPGVPFNLFTTPTTDPDAALAGDQAKYQGMMPLNIDFPGRAVVSVNIRGALATPNPASVFLLLVGHMKNKAHQ